MMPVKAVRGFTLIELMVSSIIFVVILIAVYSAFQTGILSYRRLTAAGSVYQTARIVLARLETDVRNSYAYTASEPRFKGDRNTLDFYAVLDSYDQNAELRRDASHVRYEFIDGAFSRASALGMDAFVQAGGGGAPEVFADIQDIIFSYAYPLNRANDEYDWQTLWPKNDEQKQLMPLAVKIEVTIRETGTHSAPRAVVFTKIVGLPRANIP